MRRATGSPGVASVLTDPEAAAELAADPELRSPLQEKALPVAFSVRYKDRLVARLMLVGLAVRVAELAADAWLVDATGTFDDSLGGGPMLWRSPAWMPLAWEMVGVQIGYLGLGL
jgi:hypothetical protein